jgi:hemolysin activation/secretion protein
MAIFAGCGRMRGAWRAVYGLTFLISGLAAPPGVLAQDIPAPKIESPFNIPSTVRPGVVEIQLEVDLTPDFSGAPVILSPYEPEQPANANAIVLTLNEIIIDGGGVIPATDITATYSDLIGTEIHLSEVFNIARAITQIYARNGYPLSLAYVPVQEINKGVVRIRVLEGFIGEVDIIGAPQRAEAHLRKLGEKLKAERPLTQRALERYLLLANQLPGLSVTGVLERAKRPEDGVKMTLSVTPKRFSIAAGINNRASTAVGRKQFYGRLNANSLITGTDHFGFAAVQSVDLDELTYFSSSYGTLLNAEGLALKLTATRSEAAPGIPFLRDLGFETMGWTARAELAYPLIVRRDKSLTLTSRVMWKEFKSAFGVSPNTLDTLWTTSFGAAFTLTDRFGGNNAIGVNLTRGWDIFDATQAGSALASRAGAGGEFVSLATNISRKQRLNEWLNALVAIEAQTANNPLLSSEQCGYGGAGFGRGFDPFEISGDRCIVGLLELQASPKFLQFGKVVARPYFGVDAGAVRQIGPLAAGEERTRSLYSLSGGARISLTKHVAVGLEGALPLKDTSPGSGRDARFFFSIEARY